MSADELAVAYVEELVKLWQEFWGRQLREVQAELEQEWLHEVKYGGPCTG